MNPELNLEKIMDEELVAFAKQDEEGTVSVIIEILAEDAQIEMSQTGSDEDRFAPIAAPPIDEKALRHKMDKLEKEIENLCPDNLIRLDTAQAFVADVTSSQLRAVSLLENVGYVLPNRTHRI